MTQQRPKYCLLRAVPLIAAAAVTAAIACDAAGDAVGAPPDRDTRVAATRAERERAIVVRESRTAAADREQRVAGVGFDQTVLPVESEVVSDSAVVFGIVNDQPQVQLRLAGSGPVVYIDGERVEAGTAAFKDLDPAAIESIEVIKPGAAALYGPDHAAGVIRIYTNR